MNKITRIGLDIAKNTFVLHAVNEQGKTLKRHTCDRAKVLSFFAEIEPCLVGDGLFLHSEFEALLRSYQHLI